MGGFSRSSDESITCPCDLEHIRLAMAEWLARSGAVVFFTLLAQINLLLMLFNLIPLGPLDGHYILPHLLPARWAQRYRHANARFGTGIFLALVVLSLAGLPFLSALTDLSRTMLDWITLFN